jgi:regulation of enolase protein 1 (concanavalin A-like superfamily)
MSRVFCGSIALTVAGVSFLSAVAADKPAQTIAGFGTVVDPDGDCRFADRVKMTISVPNTMHGITYRPEPGQSKLNAPRLVQDVKGDFQITIKVAAFATPPTKASTTGRPCHQAAGLFVWQDDRNFIRLERAGSGGTPEPRVYFERFEDGQSTAKRNASIEDTDAYLRITRTGDTFVFRISDDGREWTKIQTLATKYSEQIKVGVHAINTSVERFSPTIEIPAPDSGEGSFAQPAGAAKPVPIIRTLSAALDPDGDCKFNAEPIVTITVPGTNHDLARKESYVKQNAPRVLDDIKGDFRLAVKVAAFPTPKPDTSANNQLSFVGAGVLVWQDDRNYVRLERVAEGNSGAHFVLLESYVDGKEASSDRHDIDDRDTYLRVTREGNNLTFETGADGSDWTKLKTLELKLPEQLKAGVAAINTTTSEFSATIEVPPPGESEK